MTPGARVAAAIEILDQIIEGSSAAQVLTRWARRNRFAGSKDRAAIRDHVFDVLRCWRTGRGLMIGILRRRGIEPSTLFTGEGHAPPQLVAHETAATDRSLPRAARLDLPDWLIPQFDASLGADSERTALALQERAPVSIRVNNLKTDTSGAILMLRESGIDVRANPLSPTTLTVVEGERKLRNVPVYTDGFVELQDASSQAVVDALPPATRMLDYCAGGGGKALALAARRSAEVFAHDIDPALAAITQLASSQLPGEAPFDLVLVDAPCSGSGSWRRAPEAKWRLTPERLEELTGIQDDILDAAAGLVRVGGTLAYATCSVLQCENDARIDAFLSRHKDWHCSLRKMFAVDENGDGFFTAHLTQKT